MTIFTLSNGKEFKVDAEKGHDGKYFAVLGEREYSDGSKSIELPEEFSNSADIRYSKQVTLSNFQTGVRREAQDTYLLAENKDYKDTTLPESYLEHGFAGNCNYHHKIEITLMHGEFKKRLFTEWNGTFSLTDYLSNLEWRMEEAIEEGEFKSQGILIDREYPDSVTVWMYNDKGDFIDIDFDKREFLHAIVSVKVIDFQESIAQDFTQTER